MFGLPLKKRNSETGAWDFVRSYLRHACDAATRQQHLFGQI
jgi:hypothetical protein